jgi:hypothetical protein
MGKSSRSPKEEPSEHDDDEGAGDEAPEEVGGMEGWLNEQLKKTPWWIISIVFHAVVLGLLATVQFAHEIIFEENTVTISLASRENEKLQDVEKPRDVFDKGGIDTPNPDPTQEPTIFFPNAEESDHNESADNEDTNQMKGDSYEFSSYLPGQDSGTKGRQDKGRGVSDAMGVGGGGGAAGRYGGRSGGRRNLVARGGSQATESAVTAGLRWLARHQGDSGGWACDGFSAMCAGAKCSGPGAGEFDVGVTGLSLLAFLGAGYTHLTRTTYDDFYTKKKMSFGKVVKKGLDFLIAQQDSNGCLGRQTGEYMYNHTIGALALAEAYGLTNAAVYKQPAQKAIDFLIEAQNPGLGWRYTVRPGNNDTSVTGWAVMALKSAHISGLNTPRPSFDGARAWVERVTDGAGLAGYTAVGTVDVFVPGKNDAWSSHPSMTAIGLLLRIYIDSNQRDPVLAKSAKLIIEDKPVWDEANHKIDCYYWYYATLALFQYQDGGGLSFWKQWNDAMKNTLVPNQKLRKDGCADGSWSPEVDRWGFAGGRVYVTAVNTMSLEVYYRYESVFGKGAGGLSKE